MDYGTLVVLLKLLHGANDNYNEAAERMEIILRWRKRHVVPLQPHADWIKKKLGWHTMMNMEVDGKPILVQWNRMSDRKLKRILKVEDFSPL